jgi:PiT family inorganic phosphate transporter
MTTVAFILALLLGFYVAWTIGANDVANSVGTAVGSGALSLKNAILVAALFEFAGAFILGSNVSETVESGILGKNILLYSPQDYLVGMFASLLASGVWLQFATFFGWPVSTTHTIVGAVVGFGLIVGGFGSIAWIRLASIALSWILSPLMGAIVAYLIFSIIQRKIFHQANPLTAMNKWTPWIAFTVFFSHLVIIFFDGLEGLGLQMGSAWLILASGLVGLLAAFIAKSLVKDPASNQGFEEVEKIFMSFQVVIACFMAFAHGSNDVANVIGPLSGIVNVLQGNPLVGRSVPVWLLLLGGAGIVVGFATWGWRVIDTVGKKITQLTPSRGFAAGFASTLTIMLASKLGLPISTTHVLVGAVLGVGFARGIGAINLNTVRDIFVSWVITVPIGAVLSILFFFLIKLAI